ncbi:acyl transferase/acyl hydrolase/lysophospholipase [Hypomontagnella monticulosa]|nr:acyl transferase/acyl hydrolase/lysophospholipase [Hypomontagnella monticulosa]
MNNGSTTNLKVLSIDGGGIRGFATLLVLKELMRTVSKGDGPELKPCEYFSVITGAGMGGVLALLLGRLKLSVSQCMVEYWRLSSMILRREKLDPKPPLFDATKLRKVMDDIVQRHSPNGRPEDSLLIDPRKPEDVTKTCVFATLSGKRNRPHCFRTYENANYKPHEIEMSPLITISDVAVAAAAAEGLFKPASLPSTDNKTVVFLDAPYPLGLIDATSLALQEVNRLVNTTHIGLVISIGSGRVADDDIDPLLRLASHTRIPAATGTISKALRSPRRLFNSRTKYQEKRYLGELEKTGGTAIGGKPLSPESVIAYLNGKYRETVDMVPLDVYRRFEIPPVPNVGPNDFLSTKEVGEAVDIYLGLIQLPSSLSFLQRGKKFALRWAARTGNDLVVKKLLSSVTISAGTLNDRDDHGYTPLHWAVENDHQSVVALLLGHPNIDVNATVTDYPIGDNVGKTALELAFERKHDGIVSLLQPRADLGVA